MSQRRTNTGAQGHSESKTPEIKNKTIEADYYAQRHQEAIARRNPSPEKVNGRDATQEKRDNIAACLINGMTPSWCVRNLGVGEALVHKVQGDLFLRGLLAHG
jgi:hypothetical protein